MPTLGLPKPVLSKGRFVFIDAYTDEALFEAVGVRIAFTERGGGVSAPPYDSLDLALHVKDDPAAVMSNRAALLAAVGAADCMLVNPNQVHGDTVLAIDDAAAPALGVARARAAEGADALVVGVDRVAALLCYADCVPLILVAPGGHFAVVHAGWRGVDAHIAVKALDRLLSSAPGVAASEVNVYRGAYIHAECFETGEEVHRRFVDAYGQEVAFDDRHIDLGRALDFDLTRAGIVAERIADVGCCTVCDNGHWFSYRAQGGVCGRHGAFACRLDSRKTEGSHHGH